MTEPIPAVRKDINEAQQALMDLTDYVTKTEKIDLTRMQLLASQVLIRLERATTNLANATCDIEASLNRL